MLTLIFFCMRVEGPESCFGLISGLAARHRVIAHRVLCNPGCIVPWTTGWGEVIYIEARVGDRDRRPGGARDCRG